MAKPRTVYLFYIENDEHFKNRFALCLFNLYNKHLNVVGIVQYGRLIA